MGCLAFESRPPFKPVRWTQEPILSGSQHDEWGQRKPLVVFPCGALLEDDWWTISLGVNDLKCAWLKIPHEDVEKLLENAPEKPGVALLASPTVKPVFEHIPYTEEIRGLGTNMFDIPDVQNKLHEKNQEKDSRRPQAENAPVLAESSAVEGDRIYKPHLAPGAALQRLPEEPLEQFEQRVEATLPPVAEAPPAVEPKPRKKYRKRRKKKH
jgi:hypothetical protein